MTDPIDPAWEPEGVEDPLGPPATGSDLSGEGEPASEAEPDPAAPPTQDVEGAGAPADDEFDAIVGGLGDEGPEPADLGAAASVEELIVDLEQTIAERDEYLDVLRRTQADFENYRKRVAKQQVDEVARAAGDLVEQLLPVLDACDGAIHHGATEVEPIYAALLGTLEKQGLERIDPAGEAFDPNQHEAVMHEAAEDGDEGIVVSAVMRPGYGWKGRIVRPAMVKVRG